MSQVTNAFLTKKIERLLADNARLVKTHNHQQVTIGRLELHVNALERELEAKSFDMSRIPPKPISKKVLGYMREHGLSWEAFYCYECESWYRELDALFPCHGEMNQCKC